MFSDKMQFIDKNKFNEKKKIQLQIPLNLLNFTGNGHNGVTDFILGRIKSNGTLKTI